MRKLIYILIFVCSQNAYGQEQLDNYLKARSLMIQQSYDSAIFFFNKAETENPGKIDILFNRGLCNFKLNMYEKAIADFIFVNKRKSGMASLMLSKTEARLNHKELSIKYLRQHLSSSYKIPEKDILLDEDLIRFESSSAWKTLWKEKNWYSVYDQKLQEVAYLRSNGDLLEALNLLNELEEKGYKRSLTNQFIAEIYLSTGNRKSAKEALDKAIRSDTRNMESLKLRIHFLMNDGDFNEAQADCDRLLRQAPYEFEYYLISGEINSLLGNYDAAKKSIDFYINYFPNSYEAFNRLGKIHYENGKYLNALSALNRSLKLYDGYAESFFYRGLTYAATKTFKYAERDFSMALDLDPLNGDIWFEKGLVDMALEKKILHALILEKPCNMEGMIQEKILKNFAVQIMEQDKIMNNPEEKVIEDKQLSILKSGNKNAILDTIKEIRDSGNINVLPEIFELILSSEDGQIISSSCELLNDLKTQEAAELILSALKNDKYKSIRSFLTAACWQNGLKYHEEYQLFANILIEEDYLTAIEAFTVIENCLVELEDNQILKLLQTLSGSISIIQDEKKILLEELISVIKNY